MMGAATWDDDLLISGAGLGGNRFVTSFTHPFLGIYYRPLTSFSFAVDSAFSNQTPFYYHQTNILLHALTAVLVCCLGFLITRKQVAGVLAGLFFATQPMQVGAAAWIGGRTDDLSGLFLALFMVSLVCYHINPKRGWLALSVVSFLLAALSKEQAVFIFPAASLSVFVFGSKKAKDAWRLTIPFGLALLAYIGLWVIGGPMPHGAKSGVWDMVTLSLRTVGYYGLAFLTPNRASLLTFTLENYVGFAWVLTGIAMVAALGYFLRTSWKSCRPLAWLAVCGILVYMPVSNFPPVPTYVVGPYRVAECGLAVACLLGIGLAYGISTKRYLLVAALGANLVAGALTTWWGVHQWNSTDDLFTAVSKTDPHFIIGSTKHATTLENQGRLQEALEWRQRTLRWVFNSDNWSEDLRAGRVNGLGPEVLGRLRTNGGIPFLSGLAWLMCNQASTLAKLHRIPEARTIDEEALAIAPDDFRINFAYGQLILDADRKRAIHYMEIALKLAPRSPVYAMALAHERVKDGRYAEAVQLLAGIIKTVGWNGSAWIDLADARIGTGDLDGASSALAGAGQAMFAPKKSEIETRRKRIESLRLSAHQRSR